MGPYLRDYFMRICRNLRRGDFSGLVLPALVIICLLLVLSFAFGCAGYRVVANDGRQLNSIEEVIDNVTLTAEERIRLAKKRAREAAAKAILEDEEDQDGQSKN